MGSKLRIYRALPILLAGCLWAAGPLAAESLPVSADARKDLSLTIYSQDLGLVREIREGAGKQGDYDLAVEVALIRTGPIQGQSVHPYLRRRHGEEPIRYPHPTTGTILKKTLGVPIFQEQLMELARVCAGFDGSQADRLRDPS